MTGKLPNPGIYMTAIDICPVCKGQSRSKSGLIVSQSTPSCPACQGQGMVMGLVPAHEFLMSMLIALKVPMDTESLERIIEGFLQKENASETLSINDQFTIKGEA